MSPASKPTMDDPEEDAGLMPTDAWPLDAAVHVDDDSPGDAPCGGTQGQAVPSASDAQLAQWIQAVAQQDERALASLYDATIGRVFGLVQRIVRDAAVAEEAVEDAYFQVWRQAVRFDPTRGTALAWLLSMARSRAIDTLRRHARFKHDSLDTQTAQEIACEAPAADALLDLARQRNELHLALMRLGAQPRQLVSMAFLRGLSHEEIAEQTQLPLGTVKSQIRRALQSLRSALEPRGAQATVS